MNTPLRIDIAMLLVIGLLTGCGKNAPLGPGDSSSNVEESEVSGQLASNPEYVDDGLSESSDSFDAEAAGAEAEMEAGPASVGMEAAIRPIRFWRHITNVRRSFALRLRRQRLDRAPDDGGRHGQQGPHRHLQHRDRRS